MFKVVKQGTKKAQALIDSYNLAVERYGYRRLYDCYKSYSTSKDHAERSIVNSMVDRCGSGYTVISHNTFGFTCGYVYPDSLTGALVLRIDTPNNTYETWYV